MLNQRGWPYEAKKGERQITVVKPRDEKEERWKKCWKRKKKQKRSWNFIESKEWACRFSCYKQTRGGGTAQQVCPIHKESHQSRESLRARERLNLHFCVDYKWKSIFSRISRRRHSRDVRSESLVCAPFFTLMIIGLIKFIESCLTCIYVNQQPQLRSLCLSSV